MRYSRGNTADSIVGMGVVFLVYAVYAMLEAHPQIITMFLPCGIGGFITFAILYWLFYDAFNEKFAVILAPKQFVINNLTLRNDRCSVILTPRQKIVVMENNYNFNGTKRMFSVTKKDIKVSQMWCKVCRIFNETTSFEILETYFSMDSFVNVVVYDTKPVKKDKAELSEDTSKQSVKDVEKTKPVQEVQPSVVDLSERIDVNSATADEIASLPGINVIMAKKIVEYRNLNGSFKSEDEFLKIAGVKNIFVNKIKSMIIINETEHTPEIDTDNTDRIVDF